MKNEKRREKCHVLVVNTGQIFDSIRDCNVVLCIPSGVINQCLKGKRRGYKGLKFEKIN